MSEHAEPVPVLSDATTLVAVSADQYQGAVGTMVAWLGAKIAATTSDLAEITEIRRMAKQRRWDLAAMTRLATKHRAAITWYEKVRAAIVAGYTVLPDLPMTVFAVRRVSRLPRQSMVVKSTEWRTDPRLPAEVAPVGLGDYTAPNPHRSVNHSWTEQEGTKTVTLREFVNTDERDVVFPVQMLKPALVEATDRAMQAKVFDEIGILLPSHETKWRGKRRDPLVLGRIYRDSKQQAALCFNIAWFVALEDLA